MASLAVITAVKARLAASDITTPVRHPNADFQPPADGSAFVAIQYPLASEAQTTFGAPGNNVFREEGVIRFVVNIPRGADIEVAASIAEQLRALFRSARFDGVRCYAPTSLVFNDGNDEGNYSRASIAVPYDFDIHA
jgi:hypothetical protein